MGELLPSHLWEWAKTTTPPDGEAPGALFYAGFDQDVARISISWRAVLPSEGQELRPPVFAAEAIDVPVGEAREVLTGLAGGRVTRLAPDRVTVEQDLQIGCRRPRGLNRPLWEKAKLGQCLNYRAAKDEGRMLVFRIVVLSPIDEKVKPEALPWQRNTKLVGHTMS